MLKLNFEFRKGIFFIRLIGELNAEACHKIDTELTSLISLNKVRYIVLNTNYIVRADLAGLNYMVKIYYTARENNSNLVICDKFKIFNIILNNNVPLINNELEVL